MDIPKRCPRCRNLGLTLVEALTAVAVTGVVLTIGLPGYKALSGSSRVSTSVNIMAAHLHFARSEAVKRGVPVVLCPSADGSHCDDSFHWQHGLLVFADQNGSRSPGDGQPLLRYFRPDQSGVSIRTSPGRKKLVYQASGMSPGSTATITVCDQSQTASPKAIIVSNAGRPRSSRVRPDGQALDCL